MTQKECQKSKHISNPEYCNHFCSHCFLQVVLYFFFSNPCLTVLLLSKLKINLMFHTSGEKEVNCSGNHNNLYWSFLTLKFSLLDSETYVNCTNKPYNKVLGKRPKRDQRGTRDCQNLQQMKLDSLKQLMIGTDR